VALPARTNKSSFIIAGSLYRADAVCQRETWGRK
jgi:hypothetical protein